MKRLWGYFCQLSVTVQILILIIILILPINIVSMLFAVKAQNDFLQQSIDSASHTADIFMKQLDERVNAVDIFMGDDFDNNRKLLQLRGHVPGQDFMADVVFYWQELDTRVKSYGDADGYFFYMGSEDFVEVAVNNSYNDCRNDLKRYVEQKIKGTIPQRWFIENIDGEQWLFHFLQIRDFYLGGIIHIGAVAADIEEALGLEQAHVIINENISETAENHQVYLSVPSERSSVRTHIFLDKKEIMGNIPLLLEIEIILVVCWFLCIPAVLFVIRRIFIRPMAALNDAMDQMESGKTEFRMVIQAGSKETTALNKKYNSMADNLENLRIQVYEKELERRDIEATNLRLQVNPHFLLNCLNIIFSMSKSGKTAEIKNFTKYMSDYFRFALWHTHGMVTMKEEMACVVSYMQVQKIRFPGAFTYIDDIEEGLEYVQIPALLIINFVENAIKYGLKLGSEIEIIVIARKDVDSMTLSVCDTGCGMKASTLQALKKGEVFEDEVGKHIGIWNCRRRLALMYGDQAYLQITSKENEGTQVYMKLPLHT